MKNLKVKVIKDNPCASGVEVGKVYEIAEESEFDPIDYAMIEATKVKGDMIIILRKEKEDDEYGTAGTAWAFFQDVQFVLR